MHFIDRDHRNCPFPAKIFAAMHYQLPVTVYEGPGLARLGAALIAVLLSTRIDSESPMFALPPRALTQWVLVQSLEQVGLSRGSCGDV